MTEPDNTNELLAAVGAALNAWSKVEIELADLFAVLSGAEMARSQIIMASIIALESRLQVCDNLIAFANPCDELKLYWARCYNKIRAKAKKRNELAHFSILPKSERLTPYFSAGRMWMNPPSGSPNAGSLSVREIKEREAYFLELSRAITWFRYVFRDGKGKSVTTPLLTSDLIRHFRRPDDRNPKGS